MISPFWLRQPNVLLVSELQWPPERDRLPQGTDYLLCPRPLRDGAAGLREALPSDCLMPLSPLERTPALHLCGPHAHLQDVLDMLQTQAANAPAPHGQPERIRYDWMDLAALAGLGGALRLPSSSALARQGALLALYGEGPDLPAAFAELRASAAACLALQAGLSASGQMLCLMSSAHPLRPGQCQPLLQEARSWWPHTGLLLGHAPGPGLSRVALLRLVS